MYCDSHEQMRKAFRFEIDVRQQPTSLGQSSNSTEVRDRRQEQV